MTLKSIIGFSISFTLSSCFFNQENKNPVNLLEKTIDYSKPFDVYYQAGDSYQIKSKKLAVIYRNNQCLNDGKWSSDIDSINYQYEKPDTMYITNSMGTIIDTLFSGNTLENSVWRDSSVYGLNSWYLFKNGRPYRVSKASCPAQDYEEHIRYLLHRDRNFVVDTSSIKRSSCIEISFNIQFQNQNYQIKRIYPFQSNQDGLLVPKADSILINGNICQRIKLDYEQKRLTETVCKTSWDKYLNSNPNKYPYLWFYDSEAFINQEFSKCIISAFNGTIVGLL